MDQSPFVFIVPVCMHQVSFKHSPGPHVDDPTFLLCIAATLMSPVLRANAHGEFFHVRHVEFFPDGSRIVSAGSTDLGISSIRIWDVGARYVHHFFLEWRHACCGRSPRSSLRPLLTLRDEQHPFASGLSLLASRSAQNLECISLSKDGRFLLSGASDGNVIVWGEIYVSTPPVPQWFTHLLLGPTDATSLVELARYRHVSSVFSAVFSPDGTRAVLAGRKWIHSWSWVTSWASRPTTLALTNTTIERASAHGKVALGGAISLSNGSTATLNNVAIVDSVAAASQMGLGGCLALDNADVVFSDATFTGCTATSRGGV
jgi:hypothetical protein